MVRVYQQPMCIDCEKWRAVGDGSGTCPLWRFRPHAHDWCYHFLRRAREAADE